MHNLKSFIKNLIHGGISLKTVIFITVSLLTVVSLIVFYNVSNIFYTSDLMQKESANLQSQTTILAGDFSSCENLKDAEKNGIYTKLKQLCAVDFIRFRIVDTRYVIAYDSYSSEFGRSIISDNVINAFSSRKSASVYHRESGVIEAVAPIFNSSNDIIGVLISDSNIDKVLNFENDVKNQIILTIIAIMVIFIVLLIIAIRIIFNPYSKVLDKVEDISNGHNQIRIPEKGNKELKRFAQYFNSIMDKSSSLDESRQEFVSNVSHELKTPITSIKVLADSLNMQEDVPIELYKEFMLDITNEIDRESKIIDDLLSLVKMDKAAGGMNISSVNINELIEMVLKRLTPIAQKKNIAITYESFRPVVAEVDEVKITQVVSNLVENAIKYNINDGWVHVTLNADYQYMYIKIEDSGIGIPKESQDLVFDRFYRVDKARSRQTGGTGLGLAIVHQIVLLHHGTIKLYSEGDNGTTFNVRIPLNYVG